MTNEEAKRIIKLLSYGQSSEEYFSAKIAYGRYVRVLTQLIRLTSNVERSASIFATIINQAQELNKTPEWVEQEIYVEADASTLGDRLSLMRQLLILSDGSDHHLGLYNARLGRFPK